MSAWLLGHWRHRRADAIAVVALGVLAAIVFADALAPGATLFERDIANYWCPQVEALVRSVAEGSWPVWNPYFSFGLPMWADPGYQVAYPLTWLNLVLLPVTYYKLFAVLHCWLAGAGLYVFARALRLRVLPAFAGGAAWAVSGPFLSTANLNHHYASAAWIGWVLAALVLTLRRPSVGAALCLGGVAALQVVAGSGDIVLMTAGMCLVLAPAWVLAEGRWRERRLYSSVGGAVVIAALLSAVLWLPVLTYIGAVGGRGTLGPAVNMFWSVHPLSLVDLVVPRLVADLPWSDAARAVLFEGREAFMVSLYLGIAAAGLALLGLLGRGGGVIRVCGALFLLLVVIAVGRHTPVVPLLLKVKAIALFRYPVKALLGAAVAWSILVAAGADVWMQPWGARERIRAKVGAGLMGCVALAAWGARVALGSGLARNAFRDSSSGMGEFRLGMAALFAALMSALIVWRLMRPATAPWTVALPIALVVADLALCGRHTNLVGPAQILSARPALLSALGPSLDGTRTYTVAAPLPQLSQQLTRVPHNWELDWAWAVGHQQMLAPPIGCRWRLSGSYDGDFTGFTPRPVLELGALARAPAAARRLLRIGAVDYVISAGAAVPPGLMEVAEVPSVYAFPIRVYRVPDALPRVYAVGGARVAAGKKALAALLDPTFDPAAEVVVSEGTGTAAPSGFRGAVRTVSRTFERIVLDVQVSHVAHVVVVETNVPGWRATVDGAASPVLWANAAFRAVKVPPGAHRVEMWYHPASVWYGLALSAATAAGVLLWALRRHSRGGMIRT